MINENKKQPSDVYERTVSSYIDARMENVFDKKKEVGHYKIEGTHPFDIFKILPCKDFTPFMVFCSFNILKYIWRICNGGANMKKDIEKIIHYAETLKELV